MDNSILLEVVTPERLLLSKPVQMVMAVGSDGAMGILPHHTHLLTGLKIDALRWLEGTVEKKAFISGGLMEVTPEKVSVLAESAELEEEINKERVLEARKRAEDRIAKAKTGAPDIDLLRAENALRRAISRLKILN
ncbi:MAG: ATP synthase F1 subunit epsilon [Desulfarculales bacterium]|jgi:F-type H+-transporting ATPase subunit epsilon|nr:ATP synthase F1 subunit epsilon [Desulfarculales bacterium]